MLSLSKNDLNLRTVTPMKNRLNFNQLYYFWNIAQEGSIKKASQKLNLTPSGLSGQLKQLEDFFGKKLFERKSRRLIMNDIGQIVFSNATAIFKIAEELANSVRQAKPRRQTLISVGVLPSLSKSHIHEFILPLLRDKKIVVKVMENSLDELTYQLDNKNLDIILLDRPPLTNRANMRHYRLRPNKIIAVGTEKFSSAKMHFPNSLEGLPIMVLTEHSYLRGDVDEFWKRHGIAPQIVGEADDVTLLRLAAEKGICISILPQNAVQQSISNQSLVKLGELSGINSDMWAIVKRKIKESHILEKTINKFLIS